MKPYELRHATEGDASAILRIYAPYVLESPITFECEVPSVESFAARMRQVMEKYPYLVATVEGGIVGYAYASSWHPRAAYQWGAELSVYLHPDFTHMGLGKMLYAQLMHCLKLQNINIVYGCVAVPNAASEALHGHFGFDKVALFRKAGFKCGKWHDVAWFEKIIVPHGEHPAPLLPFPSVKRGSGVA